MDKETKNTIIGTAIGSLITSAVTLGGVFIYKIVNKKKISKEALKEDLAILKEQEKVYEDCAKRLHDEAISITSYITENTMNITDLHHFDAKTWSDKLMVTNEAWKQAEVDLAYTRKKIAVLESKLSNNKKE